MSKPKSFRDAKHCAYCGQTTIYRMFFHRKTELYCEKYKFIISYNDTVNKVCDDWVEHEDDKDE